MKAVFCFDFSSKPSWKYTEVKSNNNKHQIRQQSDIKFDLGKSELNEEQKKILTQFLNQNRDVFAINLQELGKTSLYKHTINLNSLFFFLTNTIGKLYSLVECSII
jgi:hypothetical protein